MCPGLQLSKDCLFAYPCSFLSNHNLRCWCSICSVRRYVGIMPVQFFSRDVGSQVLRGGSLASQFPHSVPEILGISDIGLVASGRAKLR